MIGAGLSTLVVALLAQAAFVKGPLDIEVPDAILDLHNQYGACWDKKFDVARVRDQAGLRKETERAISACAEEKVFLERAADARLARTSDYSDPTRRRAAVAEAFDGWDRVHRAMAAGGGTSSR
ncbi:MAG TPA: hypothetical protein VF548_17320 [Allosphingosinicella sp.]